MPPDDPRRSEAAAATTLARLEALVGPVRHEIGRSSEGRSIVAWRFAASASAPAGACSLLVVGGVHGDEGSSVDAVVDLGLRVAERGGAPVGFWLVPVLNPDGWVRNRKNSARDVDLNRNFPAQNFTTEHAAGYDPGPAPLSEPETQALAAFVSHERIERVVAVHAPFACVNYDGPAAAWADAVSRACGWPVQGDIGYPTPGSLGSWLGRDRGLPILTLELPPGSFSEFQESCRAALDASVTVPGSAINPFRMR